MKNPNIAAALKDYRKAKNLSVNQVSEIFKEQGNYVAPKTIYGWESGQTQPDADTLMFLCDLYGIDKILEVFGYHKDSDTSHIILTELEKELVFQYRKHEEMHPAIHKLLDIDLNNKK